MSTWGNIAGGYLQAMPRIDRRNQLALENERADLKQKMWLAQQKRIQDQYEQAQKERAANRILATRPGLMKDYQNFVGPPDPQMQQVLDYASPQNITASENYKTDTEKLLETLGLYGAKKQIDQQYATPAKQGTDPYSLFKRLYGHDPSPEEYKEFVQSTKGPGQTITINPGAKTLSQEEAKATVAALKQAVSDRMKITQMMPKFDFMEQSDIYTGVGGEFVQNLRKLLGAKSAAEGDILQGLSNQFAMYARSPASGMGLPGAISEKEIPFLMKAMPGVMQTTKGRQALARFMKAASQAQLRNTDNLLKARQQARAEGRDFNIFDYAANAKIETVNMSDFFGDLGANVDTGQGQPAASGSDGTVDFEYVDGKLVPAR